MIKDNKKFKGFTLIELMIVVAIVGVLAAVGVPKFAQIIRMNRIERAKAHLKSYEQALRNYYSDIHRLPALADPANGGGLDGQNGLSSIGEWRAYLSTSAVQVVGEDPDSDSDGQIDNWHGHYMNRLHPDPWEHAYVFQDNRNDGDPNTVTAIISGGPEGINLPEDFSKASGDTLENAVPNELGFSIVDQATGSGYIIMLWLE